jgi:hypothetical protein
MTGTHSDNCPLAAKSHGHSVMRVVWHPPSRGTCFAPLKVFALGRNHMSWLLFALLVVMGFALLKVRRRRKSRADATRYQDSKAA